MARLVTSGFELNTTAGPAATAPDGANFGTVPTTQTAIARSGTYALKVNAAVSGVQWNPAGNAVLGRNYYLRAYIYVPTGGVPVSAANDIISAGPGGTFFGVNLETDGTLTLRANISSVWTQQGSASSAIRLDAWNMVELRSLINTGATDECEARLNGVSFASASGLNVTDTAGTQVFTTGVGVGAGGGSMTIYYDDVVANDDQGASQNTWPGSGSVVLLRPTADSAVGTGWTLGNTTATGGNAWQREDNIPPDSATDLTTTADATQIRNATSNANVNYDATMTTYTVAGVTGTVNVVVPIVATGAPVVTSAKAGTVGVASNPAIANIALGAGGTSGAFWSGVAIGTYPTGNKWSFGTTTYAPTVTLGTAPVMRVTQVTASTRIAVVTEMGIYVDYTPAVVIAPTPLVHQSVPFYPGPSRPS